MTVSPTVKPEEHNYLGSHALLLEAWWKYLELLKPFQQMVDETRSLVSQRFGEDNHNFFDDSLVCVKVKGSLVFTLVVQFYEFGFLMEF